MKTTIHVYRPGQDVENIDLDIAEDPGYFALKEIIQPLLNGADLEHVSVLFKDKPTDMFVDDVGLLKGLPRNDEATDIYRAFWMKHHPGHKPEDLSFIAGTAVVFDRQVWF